MTARELLAELRKSGFDLVKGDDGEYHPGRVSKGVCQFRPELMAELKAVRDEVIDLLGNPPGAWCGPCRSWVTGAGIESVGDACGRGDCPYRDPEPSRGQFLYVDAGYLAAERHVALSDHHDTCRKAMAEMLPELLKVIARKRKSRAKGYVPLFGGGDNDDG